MQELTIPQFSRYACVGETIDIEDGLFTFTARIEYDEEARPDDFDCFDSDDPEYGDANKLFIESWKRDEWFYAGIVISAEYNGVQLPDTYLAGLWGIEVNFPGSDNRYLSEVVKEMLPEAKEQALKLLDEIRAKIAA